MNNIVKPNTPEHQTSQVIKSVSVEVRRRTFPNDMETKSETLNTVNDIPFAPQINGRNPGHPDEALLNKKLVFNRIEAARLVGVSPHTLAKWVSERKYHPVPGKRYLLPLSGCRKSLYTVEAILEFIKK